MTRSFPIRTFDVLASTQDSVLEVGASDAPEGTTFIARTQTRGRGRSERAWWSPEGAGLWMSTLLRPRRERAAWSGISLVAGSAVRAAMEDLGVPGVSLYWPNDIQFGRRKIGGILGEARSSGDRAWIALGVGINIDLTSARAKRDMPPALASIATSLVECGEPSTVDPVRIAEAILARLWPLYERFEAGEAVPSLVGDRLAHVGSRVEVRVPSRSPWRGVVEGLGRAGELLVRPEGAAAAVTPVTGGEVLYDVEA